MYWNTTKFSQLTTEQLYEIMKFRVDIFVVEQKCAYPELDDKDQHEDTLHILGIDEDKLVAYARLLPPNVSYPDASIGRFAVDSSMRHQGIGSQLLEQCIKLITEQWPTKNIRISAQAHLHIFYESVQFEKVSDSYLEDGIPHIEMLRTV